jgi:hypothetical protein
MWTDVIGSCSTKLVREIESNNYEDGVREGQRTRRKEDLMTGTDISPAGTCGR